MHWIAFIRLIRDIFGPGLPDLDKIQEQGLLAIKIAQVFALRIDFLNEDTCRHLSRLYRHTLELPAEEVDLLLKKYTDASFRSEFADIDTRPLATASVGQVHRARLQNGTEVVVKLIKQDFSRKFVRDVRSLERLFRLIIFFYPKLQKVADPVGILKNIEEYTTTELNLLNEIAGQTILRDIHTSQKDRFDLSRLRFADFHRNLCNENILVSEYIEGRTFDELLEEGLLPYEKMLQLFHVHGFYMFAVGIFHGDIHPGNIILKDKDLYFVDTSAISRVGPKIRRGLFNFFKALAYWDYEKCAYFLNKMADVEIEGRRYDTFSKKMLTLYADFTDSTVSQVSLTRRMMETIKLGVHSGMVFEKGMYAIIKSLMYLDGMAIRCNPDAVLMRDMRPFISEMESLIETGEP